MPRIKKIKKIPQKIKEIKPESEERNESDLEQEIEKTEAQKEVDNFIEFVTSATEETVPVLEQGEIPQSPGIAQTTARQTPDEENLQAREPYGGSASAGNYSTSNSTGPRDRERNVYNPSLRQTSPFASGGNQTTPAQLADRAIGGQRFIGQEEGVERREDGGGTTSKKEYKPAHEGG